MVIRNSKIMYGIRLGDLEAVIHIINFALSFSVRGMCTLVFVLGKFCYAESNHKYY